MVGNQEIISLFNDDQMTDVLKQTFNKANCFVRKGILSCFFYFIGLYTLIAAVFPIMIDQGESFMNNKPAPADGLRFCTDEMITAKKTKNCRIKDKAKNG